MQSLSRCLSLLAFAPLAAAAVWAGERPAHAILNYYIYESGGAVVVETQGSLSLPALVGDVKCNVSGVLNSVLANICAGPQNVNLDIYEINTDSRAPRKFGV
jgi:hypothetical protein